MLVVKHQSQMILKSIFLYSLIFFLLLNTQRVQIDYELASYLNTMCEARKQHDTLLGAFSAILIYQYIYIFIKYSYLQQQPSLLGGAQAAGDGAAADDDDDDDDEAPQIQMEMEMVGYGRIRVRGTVESGYGRIRAR